MSFSVVCSRGTEFAFEGKSKLIAAERITQKGLALQTSEQSYDDGPQEWCISFSGSTRNAGGIVWDVYYTLDLSGPELQDVQAVTVPAGVEITRPPEFVIE